MLKAGVSRMLFPFENWLVFERNYFCKISVLRWIETLLASNRPI
jgi:hypothetical protein